MLQHISLAKYTGMCIRIKKFLKYYFKNIIKDKTNYLVYILETQAFRWLPQFLLSQSSFSEFDSKRQHVCEQF